MLLVLQVEGNSIQECVDNAKQVLNIYSYSETCYGGFLGGKDYVIDIVHSTCDNAFKYVDNLQWATQNEKENK